MMNEPKRKEKTIRQLLSSTRYSIDFYQREYKWQTKQVQELLDDLASKFLDDYDEKHSRDKVQNYGYYYLGSIIISRKNNQNFIIDGQQRLTTLTLLHMHLHHLQGDRPDRVKLEDLIFSEKYGRRSFNIDVEERTKVMEALYSDPSQNDFNGESESIKNIIHRFHDIEQLLDKEIYEKALPYFTDWLIENVYLVEITAYSDEDAYIIFETMNDRGLSLSPLDMLKGFLLANITDEEKRIDAAKVWKKNIQELSGLGKDEDSDAIKAWLRSQYANSIRERKKGAKPLDFDRIGTEFHRWVRERLDEIGLNESDDFYRFIAKEFHFYAKQCRRLSEASKELTLGLEAVYFNSGHNFTLQDEFGHVQDFQEFRNRIGGLLLLPKSFNASYSDKPYQEKLKHYFGQNLLAKSLHKDCYEHNPGFLKFVRESGLPFKPHEEFRKKDLEERCKLYQDIAEKLWSPDRLDAEAVS